MPFATGEYIQDGPRRGVSPRFAGVLGLPLKVRPFLSDVAFGAHDAFHSGYYLGHL
ncbi:hypothetical protein C0J52_07138 [Blattella germanica]|nr:hypothetical protein C0J52_07138 [Blattella germanica]